MIRSTPRYSVIFFFKVWLSRRVSLSCATVKLCLFTNSARSATLLISYPAARFACLVFNPTTIISSGSATLSIQELHCCSHRVPFCLTIQHTSHHPPRYPPANHRLLSVSRIFEPHHVLEAHRQYVTLGSVTSSSVLLPWCSLAPSCSRCPGCYRLNSFGYIWFDWLRSLVRQSC